MIRWITDYLGTSPWDEQLLAGPEGIVDVRLLRDGAGNSPDLIRQKIAEAGEQLRSGKRIVICCDYGMSRSNVVAAAVLAEHDRISFGDALRCVIRATGETGIKVDLAADVRKTLYGDMSVVHGSSVFVLGADGFIGRAVNREIGNSHGPTEPGEVMRLMSNPVLLDAALSEAAADKVLLFWRPPRMDTNPAAGQLITYLRNVLEVCRVREAGLIFLSGQQVFSGRKCNDPVKYAENDELSPAGAVGDGLYLAESLIRQYVVRHDLAALIVRASYVYGVGDNRPGFLGNFIRKALAGLPIETHVFRNGAPLVDLLNANDLAQAVKRAVESEFTGVMHVSSGMPVATDKLAELIIKASGSKSNVSSIEMPGKCSQVLLDASLARDALAWRPTVDLLDGVSELIRNYTSYISEKSKHDNAH